jgi:hypothetical protein
MLSAAAEPVGKFHLPARLASVARLNVKFGRTPFRRPGRRAAPKPLFASAPRTRAEPAQLILAAATNRSPRCIPMDIRVQLAA